MSKLIEAFQEKIKEYPEADKKLIISAAKKSEKLHQGQIRNSGDPYFVHPMAVAEILLSIRMDGTTIAAAFLHDTLEDTEVTRNELQELFGEEVESLVFGVTKIDIVKAKNKNSIEAETIRKVLFAMVKDIRVIIIKLADKLHNMRTLEFKRVERRREISQECLDIYAPLAGRLGISWMKDELEDLSLKHLQPEAYLQIKEYVRQRKSERAEYLKQISDRIVDVSLKEKISVLVESRAKHFYSIFQKMKTKSKSMDEIYDLLGVRILCESSQDCYIVLGLVHRTWPPIEGRFKDYIAMPKANKYQSLHTTVMASEGRLLEIQIRTEEMDQTAQFGVAAHWQYKTNNQRSKSSHHDLAIINQLRGLKNGARIASNQLLEDMKREFLKDSIYVFTPKGDVIQLPKGATALDFAYHIHTEVGQRTTGAKADGNIIPLKQELRNTQVIEILTSANSHPHVEWLRSVKTHRARSKIRAWLNRHDESLIIDKNIVARKPEKIKQVKNLKKPPNKRHDKEKVGIKIGTERNVMIRFANCCKPSTGDDIIGYVSRGRGIIVHRKSCSNLAFINDFDERTIDVEWETVSPQAVKRFHVVSRKRSDLFSEIEGAIKKYKGHLLEGKVDPNTEGQLEGNFTMEIARKEDFKAVLKNIRTIPSVITITETN